MGEICSKIFQRCFKNKLQVLQECNYFNLLFLAKPNITDNRIIKSDLNPIENEKNTTYPIIIEAKHRDLDESNNK